MYGPFKYTLLFPIIILFPFDHHIQRYYGKSLPLFEASLQPPGISYLTAEQALADYALLIQYLKAQYTGITKVIAFGGRWAWLHMIMVSLWWTAVGQVEVF